MRRQLGSRAFAHRGLHGAPSGAPENSLAAFRAAADRGYGIELDIRRAADGEAMVFHDPDLARLTSDTRRVAEVESAELTRIELRDSTERIPTLSNVLTAIGGRVPVLAELKLEKEELSGAAGPMRELVQRVVAVVNDSPTTAAIMSFRAAAMREVQRLAPEALRGRILIGDGVTDQDAVAAEESDFVAWRVEDLPTPQAAAIRGAGQPVFTWTVRNAATAARVAECTDAIIFEDFLPPVEP